MSNIQNITKERNNYQKIFNLLNKNSPWSNHIKNVINALESWLNYLKTKKVTPNLENKVQILLAEGILRKRNSTFNWFTNYVSNEEKLRRNSQKEEEKKLKEFLFNSKKEEEKKLKEFLFNSKKEENELKKFLFKINSNSNNAKSPRTPLSNRFRRSTVNFSKF